MSNVLRWAGMRPRTKPRPVCSSFRYVPWWSLSQKSFSNLDFRTPKLHGKAMVKDLRALLSSLRRLRKK